MIKLCNNCKQPIVATPAVSFPAPNGATWHMHVHVRDCVRAMWAATKVRLAA